MKRKTTKKGAPKSRIEVIRGIGENLRRAASRDDSSIDRTDSRTCEAYYRVKRWKRVQGRPAEAVRAGSRERKAKEAKIGVEKWCRMTPL